MFPVAHLHYSILAAQGNSTEQLIGAVLPDAFMTAAIEWGDLHEAANVDAFAASSGPLLDDLVKGVRHHLLLDDRSHHNWSSDGGYAYSHQTPELRSLVASAFSLDAEMAKTIAHNVIETAVDMHLLKTQPSLLETLHDVSTADKSAIVAALGRWKGTDEGTTLSRTNAFFQVWFDHTASDVESAINLWGRLIDEMNEAMPKPLFRDFRRTDVKEALELALDLTSEDFFEVATP